jgi:hypothetical protein
LPEGASPLDKSLAGNNERYGKIFTLAYLSSICVNETLDYLLYVYLLMFVVKIL